MSVIHKPREAPVASGCGAQLLTPNQARAMEVVEQLMSAACYVGIMGYQGAGKTTILKELSAKYGGFIVSKEDVARVVAKAPPERSDSAIMDYFEFILGRYDLVFFDDFTDLIENGSLVAPDFGQRMTYFARFIVPQMINAVKRAGKTFVVSGRPLLKENSTVPDAPELLYGSPEVALAEIGASNAEDYAQIVRNCMEGSSCDNIDFEKLHQFAAHLNGYQIKNLGERLSSCDSPTTDQAIAITTHHYVRANTRTAEVEALTFDTLPGAEELVEKLEKHVVLPLENLDLARELDLRPKRGVLLFGPPGTGKTSIGRALAHRMRGKFFLIDGSVVTDWPGNFFLRFKSIMDQAKQSAPSIVFIDDADVLFTIPAIAGIPRYLLSLMDGMESETAGKVCIMMTAMNPSHIPEALLRSGRVELWLETKLPAVNVRESILRRWMSADLPEVDAVDYVELARATEGRTPADLRRLIADAKTLYASDKVRDRPSQTAASYLLRAIEHNAETRSRMSDSIVQLENESHTWAAGVVGTLTDVNFSRKLTTSEVPVIVAFVSSNEGFVFEVEKYLNDLLRSAHGTLNVAIMDVMASREMALRYQVDETPTVVGFIDGHEISRMVWTSDEDSLAGIVDSLLGESNGAQPRDKYGLGMGGVAETGTGCKVRGW